MQTCPIVNNHYITLMIDNVQAIWSSHKSKGRLCHIFWHWHHCIKEWLIYVGYLMKESQNAGHWKHYLCLCWAIVWQANMKQFWKEETPTSRKNLIVERARWCLLCFMKDRTKATCERSISKESQKGLQASISRPSFQMYLSTKSICTLKEITMYSHDPDMHW